MPGIARELEGAHRLRHALLGRVRRLEALLCSNAPSWEEITDANRRILSRALLKLDAAYCEHMGGPLETSPFRERVDQQVLTDDSPELARQDEEMLDRWYKAKGIVEPPDARADLMNLLNRMAARAGNSADTVGPITNPRTVSRHRS